MEKRKVTGYVGVLIYGGATLGLAFSETDPKQIKQLNDVGKSMLTVAQAAGTTTASAATMTYYVPNPTVGAGYDATQWDQLEGVVANPAFRVFRT